MTLLLQLMTRCTAQLLFANMRLQRWCFDVELIFLAQQLHVPFCEVPVVWTEMPGFISPQSITYAYQPGMMPRLLHLAKKCWVLPVIPLPAPYRHVCLVELKMFRRSVLLQASNANNGADIGGILPKSSPLYQWTRNDIYAIVIDR